VRTRTGLGGSIYFASLNYFALQGVCELPSRPGDHGRGLRLTYLGLCVPWADAR